MNDMYESMASPIGPAPMVPYGPGVAGMGMGGDSLFQILWRGRWLMVLTTLLAAAGAYVYLCHATPLYESVSNVLVEKPSRPANSDVPLPVGSTLTNYLATQASLMTSSQTLAAALRDPNVVALPTFSDPNYVRAVVGTLSAEVAKKTDTIQVRASAPRPEEAAQLVNAVVRAYIRWHDANRQLTTADVLKDLNSQLESRYSDLQLKRKEQMLFEQRNPQVIESSRGGIASKTLDALKEELATARLTAMERDSYYQGLQRFEKESAKLRQYVSSYQPTGATTTDSTERTRLKAELDATKVQLQALTASTVPIQRAQLSLLQDRQAELEDKIAELDVQFAQDQVALAKTLADDAHQREKQLSDTYEKEFAKVQSLSEQDSQYVFLKSECEMMERMCNSLLNQINQLDLSARLEGLKIYVLDRAAVAKTPSSPVPTRIIGIGLVLGLMAGAGLSFLRDWGDQRIRSQEEITALVGAPVLGTIPSIPRWALQRGQRLRFAANSRESEACRAIRTAFLCGMRQDEARIILVTSPGPHEGKTLVVSNLAMAMAQAGQKTLIVDADLRQPPKQRVFLMERNGRGLVDVLEGRAALRDVIRPAETPGLEVLESGRCTPSPSELLSSPAFARVVAELKSLYDRILVDSPPVGIVTDAQILATVCDTTLLVVRAEESSRLLTQQARDALVAVGARVAGVVVNDVSRRNSRYNFYGSYGQYYPEPDPDGHNGSKSKKMEESATEAASHDGNDLLMVRVRQGSAGQAAGEGAAPVTDVQPQQRDATASLDTKECGGKPKSRKQPSRPNDRVPPSVVPKGGPKVEGRGSEPGAGTGPGADSASTAETPKKARRTADEPPRKAGPSPDGADQAAERWKKWLEGRM